MCVVSLYYFTLSQSHMDKFKHRANNSSSHYLFLGYSADNKPQMLLFSATIPDWVKETADKYMTSDHLIVDLVGKNTVRTAVNVNVRLLL